MSHSKEATMASPDRPSFFGRDDNPFGTLFREVQRTFEDFSRRTPFARQWNADHPRREKDRAHPGASRSVDRDLRKLAPECASRWRSERPCSRRAAENGDEIPSSQMTEPVSPRSRQSVISVSTNSTRVA